MYMESFVRFKLSLRYILHGIYYGIAIKEIKMGRYRIECVFKGKTFHNTSN